MILARSLTTYPCQYPLPFQFQASLPPHSLPPPPPPQTLSLLFPLLISLASSLSTSRQDPHTPTDTVVTLHHSIRVTHTCHLYWMLLDQRLAQASSNQPNKGPTLILQTKPCPTTLVTLIWLQIWAGQGRCAEVPHIFPGCILSGESACDGG